MRAPKQFSDFSFLDLLKEQAHFVESGELEKVMQSYRNLFKKSPVKSSFPSDLHDEVPLVAWHKQNLGISTEAVKKIPWNIGPTN